MFYKLHSRRKQNQLLKFRLFVSGIEKKLLQIFTLSYRFTWTVRINARVSVSGRRAGCCPSYGNADCLLRSSWLADRRKLPELFILWSSAQPRDAAPLRLNQRLGRASYDLSLSLFPKSLSRGHSYRARASSRACAPRPAPGGLLRGGGPSGFRDQFTGVPQSVRSRSIFEYGPLNHVHPRRREQAMSALSVLERVTAVSSSFPRDVWKPSRITAAGLRSFHSYRAHSSGYNGEEINFARLYIIKLK